MRAPRTSRISAPCVTRSRRGSSVARSRTPSRRRSAWGWPDGWSGAGSTRCTSADPQPGAGVRFLVVDWKTSAGETADPWQLAIYRLAWAEAMRIVPEQVDAAFYYVRTDRLVRPASLAGRSELETILDQFRGDAD